MEEVIILDKKGGVRLTLCLECGRRSARGGAWS